MIKTKYYIIESLIIATVITAGLTIATQIFTELPINYFELFAVFFSFACTWLCTRQVRFNYVFGVISTILLSITFWQANLLGSMALNLYLIPTVIYGWFIWGADSHPKPVEHVKLKTIPLYAIFTGLTWLGALGLIKFFGGEMAMLDGWLLVGSVFAQFLLDRKKIETWIIWISVNIVSVYVYFEAGLYLLAAQFALFLINAFIGYYQWNKTVKQQEVSA
ncbi:nicotinamide mononucleotide transporter PnuC [Candidatus Dojkabacteria bacterium]|uniref:Nicotinamide mononucleotide transporter PnuC n=1 Tax=Candidatus Dojkabacteria bacterium TaxID=2099670 RepID=A0A5C7JAH1_9BACT|nr:MAG: nicotinamide mononucleotide transporter PnuC [Candidatus Dojkabacteria bacterium]